jgi:hypothetical protein
MNEYEKQAADFLSDTGTTLTVVYLYTGPYFDGEEENRDIYQFTLQNKRGVYSARYGDSLRNTAINAICRDRHGCTVALARTAGLISPYQRVVDLHAAAKKAKPVKPTAYHILACLSGYDPGTFRQWCDEYGYDTDSMKAHKIYMAVQEEWEGMCRLFTTEERERLAEIS